MGSTTVQYSPEQKGIFIVFSIELIIFDNLDLLKHSVYHPIKLFITHFLIIATFLIVFVQDLSSSVWSIKDKMRLVEIKESIHNTVITLITVARLYDKFLV
jgi:hypothetical protein